MIEQCACSKSSKAYQKELDEIVKDPRQVELYLEEHIKSGDVELAMIVMRDIIEAERRKFSDRLDTLEKRVDKIEKCLQQFDRADQGISVAQFCKGLALLGYKLVILLPSNTTGDNK